MKTMLLIDGNSIINRAFYATQNTFMTSSQGVPTGAVYGFLNIFLKHCHMYNFYFDDMNIEYLCCKTKS